MLAELRLAKDEVLHLAWLSSHVSAGTCRSLDPDSRRASGKPIVERTQ